MSFKAREADELAAAQCEIDGFCCRGKPDTFRRKNGGAEFAVQRSAFDDVRCTRHIRDQFGNGHAGAVHGGDGPPGAEHCDTVRDLLDLVHAMRDEEDGAALGLEPPHFREQAVTRLHIQRRCRLIENEDARVADQRSCNANGLPV